MLLLVLLLTVALADEPLDTTVGQVLSDMVAPAPTLAELPALKTACEAGDGVACARAGVLLRDGGDAEGAKELFDRGCRAGHFSSCMSQLALGDPRAKLTLVGQYRPQCFAEPGSAFACDQLGLYTDDKAEQRRAFERACALGRGIACYQVALMVEAEGGDPRPMLERGCALGQPDACTDLEAWKRRR